MIKAALQANAKPSLAVTLETVSNTAFWNSVSMKQPHREDVGGDRTRLFGHEVEARGLAKGEQAHLCR